MSVFAACLAIVAIVLYAFPESTILNTQTVTGISASFNWNTTQQKNGNTTLSVTVTDSINNAGSKSETVKVAN